MSDELLSTAIHEAGHAVAMFCVAVRFTEATIMPRDWPDGTRSLGHVTVDPLHEATPAQQCVWQMAGAIAVTEFRRAKSDVLKSHEALRLSEASCDMRDVARLGLSPAELLSLRLQAAKLVQANFNAIELTAHKLLHARTIDFQEQERIMRVVARHEIHGDWVPSIRSAADALGIYEARG